MDWIKLVKELSEAGLTQSQIAERCDTSQATVSDLARGQNTSPSFHIGSKLVALHASVVLCGKAAVA